MFTGWPGSEVDEDIDIPDPDPNDSTASLLSSQEQIIALLTLIPASIL